NVLFGRCYHCQFHTVLASRGVTLSLDMVDLLGRSPRGNTLLHRCPFSRYVDCSLPAEKSCIDLILKIRSMAEVLAFSNWNSRPIHLLLSPQLGRIVHMVSLHDASSLPNLSSTLYPLLSLRKTNM